MATVKIARCAYCGKPFYPDNFLKVPVFYENGNIVRVACSVECKRKGQARANKRRDERLKLKREVGGNNADEKAYTKTKAAFDKAAAECR